MKLYDIVTKRWAEVLETEVSSYDGSPLYHLADVPTSANYPDGWRNVNEVSETETDRSPFIPFEGPALITYDDYSCQFKKVTLQ